MNPATVHVVDDDEAWRSSLVRLLSAAGYRVAAHESAERFLADADPGAPGCVLLDLRMPGLSGLQLQHRLAQDAMPIVFVSGHGDIATSVLAIKAGAEDFLSKPVDAELLFAAVERALARDCLQREERRQRQALRSRVEGLTPTERKVFDGVVRGKLNKCIAATLGSTERTVKWHRRNLMEKLQVESLTELVLLAERLGLVRAMEHGEIGST